MPETQLFFIKDKKQLRLFFPQQRLKNKNNPKHSGKITRDSQGFFLPQQRLKN